jgi:hypothetical protein
MGLVLLPTRIPWTGGPGLELADPRARIVSAVGAQANDLLVDNLHILFGTESSESEARVFLEAVAAQLTREFMVWCRRLDELIALGLMRKAEVAEVLEVTRGCQPWYIYVSPKGGIYDGRALSESSDPDSTEEASGAIPCTTASHHGIAWWKTSTGRQSALITSHPVGGAWNWDEDIGHEAAHASLGPIPLFSQHFEAYGATNSLSEMWRRDNTITPEISARMHYLMAEMAVVCIRGEQRSTGTGLPGLETLDELLLFLSLAQLLFPTAGFESVAASAREEGVPLSVWSGSTTIPLRAASLRVAPELAKLTNIAKPPAFRRSGFESLTV